MSDWKRYLVGEYGFVINDEEAPEILALMPDEDAISQRYGDMVPQRIIVARDSAEPQPQSAGSDILRCQGSWFPKDLVEWDIEYTETLDEIMNIWHGAKGFADALNALPRDEETP